VIVQAPSDSTAIDRALWDTVKDSRSPDEIRAYLDQFPKGIFAGVAQARIKSLMTPPVQVASVVPNIATTRPQAPSGSLSSMAPGTVIRDCADCPEMVVIPAGSFMMGSPASEAGRFDREGPQHLVQMRRQIAVGKYEVTRIQYARFVQDSSYVVGNGCNAWDGKWVYDANKNWRNPGFPQSDDDPVVCITWDGAKAYADWLSRKSGKQYRLPSEAEWEYAARAGTTTAFSFGERITPQQANFESRVSYAGSPVVTARGRTSPAGSFAPNPFGLYDVHGNVWEWTEDCRNDNYNGAPTDGSVWASGNCGQRILRGGSWSNFPQNVRSAYRNTEAQSFQSRSFGFRVVRAE
jgi:formylglycine-generating enzyme required for sulfatase activity